MCVCVCVCLYDDVMKRTKIAHWFAVSLGQKKKNFFLFACGFPMESSPSIEVLLVGFLCS